LRGSDPEDNSSRPAYSNSFRDPTKAKGTGGMVQAAEYLFCECLFYKHEALSSNPQSHQKKKKRKKEEK
jgi:hypothetical protein